MSSLLWMVGLLTEACPDKADALKKLVLPDSDLQGWSIICRTLGRTEAEVLELLQSRDVPLAALDEHRPALGKPLLSEGVARRLHAVVAEQGAGEIVMAVCNPFDQALRRELAFSIGRRVELGFAPPDRIADAMNQQYSTAEALPARHIWIDQEELKRDAGSDEGISQLTKVILDEAVRMRASDIHIQGFLGGGLIRYRVDGLLVRGPSLPRTVKDAILRYIMAQSGLDTSNHTTPQDGRLRIRINDRQFDLRISLLPSHDESRLVIRLLDQGRRFAAANLGFPLREQRQLELLSRQNQGLILFTGPTGAGKTTSLYSLLSGINTPERNIMTVEDPVEYQLPGISQIEVDSERGRSFDAVLRAMLRQDPDVILVGEVRDEATASMVMRAVMTGHLVFSTLHTIDAVGTIQRLVDLGVTQGQIAESLSAVVAQRMVRRLCPECAVEVPEQMTPLERLFAQAVQEQPKLRAVGCEACSHTGYRGRVPLVEVYTPSEDDRRMLRTGSYLSEAQVTLQRNMATVAWHQITSGLTTVEEVTRVLGAEFWEVINPAVISEAIGSLEDASRRTQQPGMMLFGGDDALAEKIETLIDRPVVRVSGGEEGAEVLRREALIFGLIVYIDVARTPVEYLKSLRRHVSWSGLPVVFILSGSDAEIEEYLRWRGYQEWCTLPLDESQLQRLCLEAIDL